MAFNSSASGGTPPYRFTWTFGDGARTHFQNTTHAYAAAGSYTVTLWANDSVGGSASSSFTQVVNPVLAVTLVAPSNLTEQFVPFPLSVMISGGTMPYNTSWKFGDGATGFGVNVTHNYTTSGTFTVKAIVVDGAGVRNVTTLTVTVVPALSLTAYETVEITDAGQVIGFTSRDSGGVKPYSTTWDFGDGSNASGATTSHAYSATGTFTVTVSVVDALAVRAVANLRVVTNPSPNLNITITPNPTVPASAATFSVVVGGGTAPFTYSWLFGDGNNSTAASPRHAYAATGNYTVTLTVTDLVGGSTMRSSYVLVVKSLATTTGSSGFRLTVAWIALFVVIAAVILVAIALLIRRRRKSAPTPPLTPYVPPPAETAPAPSGPSSSEPAPVENPPSSAPSTVPDSRASDSAPGTSGT